jgi:SGNH hydrolase-like domain, acetyltransferase AlgX
VRGLGYVVYLVVVSAAPIECLLRLGVIDTALHQERRAIRERLTSRPRVLILGDSFSIEGPGSVGTLLREHFAASGMDTINLAKMGEGPSYYLDRLKLYGDTVRPRLILVNYFAGNDLTDTLYAMSMRGRARTVVKRLMARSFAANQLIGMAHGIAIQRRLARIEASEDYKRPGLENLTNPFMFEVRQQHPDFLLQNLLLDSPESAEAWKANERSLSEIARLTKRLGAELIVHVFPADVQVQESHYSFYRALGIQTDPSFLVSHRPQERLARFCAAAALRCYDLLPALRRANSRELYLDQDTHLNGDGNRVAFEQIRDNLVPPIRSAAR